MATVIADEIRPHDIIRVPNGPDFVHRGQSQVHAVVRDIVPDKTMPGTVGRYIVFEIAENNAVRSGTQAVALNKDNVGAYGLSPDKEWAILIDPIEIKVNEYNYHTQRTGHLVAPDEDNMINRVMDMGGDDYVYTRSEGPKGFRTRTRDADLASSGVFVQQFIGTDSDLERAEEKRAQRQKYAKRKKGNESYVVDLPIGFAGKVMNLDENIIDALRKKGLTSMRDVRNIASTPEALAALFPVAAQTLPDITIDEAIEAGYLDRNTRGLSYVVEPITPTGKPITTLNELFKLTHNDGAGFNTYTGLASKTAKTRLELTQATQQAWTEYSQKAPAGISSIKDVASQIKGAWDTLMDEYQNLVRPYINELDKGGVMVNEQKIPEKFKENGRLVFTFPKISTP